MNTLTLKEYPLLLWQHAYVIFQLHILDIVNSLGDQPPPCLGIDNMIIMQSAG